MKLMETSTTSHWVLRYNWNLQCLQSDPVTLMSSQCVPGGNSQRLQLSSHSRTPAKIFFAFSEPTFSTPELKIWKPCKDLMTPGGKAYLLGGWWVIMGRKGGEGEREKRKTVLSVMLVKFFTANHTQDWFTVHFALLTHFSYHPFHCPISLFHQGQMKGMIACASHKDLL